MVSGLWGGIGVWGGKTTGTKSLHRFTFGLHCWVESLHGEGCKFTLSFNRFTSGLILVGVAVDWWRIRGGVGRGGRMGNLRNFRRLGGAEGRVVGDSVGIVRSYDLMRFGQHLTDGWMVLEAVPPEKSGRKNCTRRLAKISEKTPLLRQLV